MEVILKKSKAQGKKFAAVFTKDGHTKTVNFGAEGYQDYTQHHDPERQKKYLARHSKDPRKFDTAGELSRTILWSSPSLNQAIQNYEKKHGIKVIRRLN